MSISKNCICCILFLTVTGCADVFAQNSNLPDSVKINQAVTAAEDSSKKVDLTEPVKIKKDNRPISKRLSFGINSSFWTNHNNTYLDVSPLITYHFPKMYSVGAGPVYVLNRDKRVNISMHGWGGKVYGRADFNKWIYGWTEYQGISNQYMKGILNNKPEKANRYISSWFFSLGTNLPLGKTSINLQVLYDVLYNKDKSYTYSPVTYRIGIGF